MLAAHDDTSTPFNLVHLPELTRTRLDGDGLELRPVTQEGGVVHHAVSYRGAGLTITGTLTRPDRAGRYPLVILAHGYHHPSAYDPVQVSRRERVYLASRGFVVLQSDYRNYGGSTREDDRLVARPTGYPEDLLNAVRALRRADLSFVRRGAAHLFGRSMGGGVALQAAVARPAWFSSVVLSGTALRRAVVEAYGLPRDNPVFWRQASVRRYLQRLEVPVHVHHGARDDVCCVAWSRRTVRAVRRSGGSARLHTYDGAEHTFHGRDWTVMMRRVVAVYR